MLQRTLLLGTLPAALLSTVVVATPMAQANESESCDLARQDHCYGEGNAVLDCYDELDPDARLGCLRRTAYLCEVLLVKVCEELPGGGAGVGGGSISYSVECPPGTQPDVLGRCTAKLRQREDGPDLDPSDWCPPGFVPGPTDDCVPAVSTVRLVPSDGGGWGIVCPPGSKPGPIDGCVLDLGEGGAGVGEGCPPGTAPAPDDGGCVPKGMSLGLGNVKGMLMMDALNQSGALTELPAESAEALEASGVRLVGDPVEALAATAEALGADIAEPTEPGAW